MANVRFDEITLKMNGNSSFVSCNETTAEQLTEGSKTKNTNRSTESTLTRLCEFLLHSNLPQLGSINVEDLPKILTNFYMSVRTNKSGEMYQTSSFKVLRACLNCWFKQHKQMNIVSDEQFMHANLVFDDV